MSRFMSGTTRSFSLEELMAHADWVRKLARRLAGDDAAADDLVQETWVAAMRRPPRADRDARSWLGTVVRNAARQLRRGGSRRDRRERESARDERIESTAELVERAALQRDVAGLVLELDEPFRTVVLLRFFEQLSPPEVAERLGVPLKTVHSRQQRAFAALRERIERERGDLSLALLPLVPMRDIAPLPWIAGLGGLLLNSKFLLGIAATVVLAGAVGLSRSSRTSRPSAAQNPAEQRVAIEPASTPIPADVAPAIEGPSERSALVSEMNSDASESSTLPLAASQALTVRGRAVDLGGSPLAGVLVATDGSGTSVAETNFRGEFELELRELTPEAIDGTNFTGRCLHVAEPGYFTMRESCIKRTNTESEHLVVATTATSMSGHVVTPENQPIANARIWLGPQLRSFYTFPHTLDMTRQVELTAKTGLEGEFTFEEFPASPGIVVHLSADGFLPLTVQLDDEALPYRFEMRERSTQEGPWLQGVVLEEGGFAAEDALVMLGTRTTRTASDGTFRLLVKQVRETVPLVAAKVDRLPAIVENFGALLASEGATEPVQLVLGGTPYQLAGRVVDTDGKPCAKWTIAIEDETEVSRFVLPITSAESLMRTSKRVVFTDDDGRFVLTGLFPRVYSLRAFDEKTLFLATGSFEAGATNVELVANRETLGVREGYLVDTKGNPLPDVRVVLQMITSRGAIGYLTIDGPSIVTNENGYFRFENVPAVEVFASYGGETVLPGRFELDDPSKLERVEVLRRAHFRIELGDARANQAQFYDANGKSLQVNRFEAHGMSAWTYVRLEDGASPTLSVSELAVEMVLRADEVELARHPVKLDPGEITILRF